MPDVVAIACSDIHLCHTCPPARSNEGDWYFAMRRTCDQLKSLAQKYNVPVLCAGDIFDRWNSPPELINFAIRNLPNMIAVPGQHDLPYHSNQDVHRSAFWTLVEAKVIDPGEGMTEYFPEYPENDNIQLHVFPWGLSEDIGFEFEKCSTLSIALIHAYIGTREHSYPGAPVESMVSGWRDRLQGYDIAIFGDNHSGFITKAGKCTVVNCGCLIQRKSNERHYKPAVYLIYEDGSVEPHYIDTSQDKWIDEKETKEEIVPTGLSEFLTELEELEEGSLDFREAIDRYIVDNDVDENVKQILLDSIGE